ncbi:MucR family transcriptional regulator [Epibacterium sp. MM17-32]|uniref:MucR family transcriptional regulator n=1 Tax=Epibacterium sp. MM17-32 TaxID=2917734 RepID=UPI001EF60BC4|nr:MucR family transcriptional regulator [Epibacterium sp. MM17-32]MCG7629063.1 MucR family transcriptional regulator [Epibacterium sp. MM17-32]
MNTDLLLKAGDIVAAYVSRNDLPADKLPELVEQVAARLLKLDSGQAPAPGPTPAVPVEESYGDDFIICLEDGKRVTLLARHLKTHFDMTPEEYRERWGLPEDYPFVTKAYSEQRSKIAKENKLGKS